jgi:hypothetical protein
MKKLLTLVIAAAAASSALAQVNEVTLKVRMFTRYTLQAYYVGDSAPFNQWTFSSSYLLSFKFRHPIDRFRPAFYRVIGHGRVDQSRAFYNSFAFGTMKITAGTDFLSGQIGGDLYWRNQG